MKMALIAMTALMPIAVAYADGDSYKPPVYHGGLIDSYDRYDPQLHKDPSFNAREAERVCGSDDKRYQGGLFDSYDCYDPSLSRPPYRDSYDD